MRSKIIISSFLFIALISAQQSYSQNTEKEGDFPVLKGDYIGQEPPGLTPKVFAPGIVSTDLYEINSVFSPDGKEFYWVISASTPEEKAEGTYFYYLMHTKQVNGIWTKPAKLPIAGLRNVVDIAMSPDGNRLYFCSDQYDTINYSAPLDICYVKREGDGWGEPIKLGAPINTPNSETQPSFARNGTRMYFSSGWDEVGIYYSDIVNGKFTEPVYLSDSINGGPGGKGNSFMAPDESYIIFARWGMPENSEIKRGMYVCFKKKDGTWTQPIYARDKTGMHGSLAALSPDGKYLFYSSREGIMWVDVKILDKLKPKYLK